MSANLNPLTRARMPAGDRFRPVAARLSACAIAAWLACQALQAGAQTLPDAGAIRQQIEQDRERSLPPPRPPAEPSRPESPPASRLPELDAPQFEVRQFRFEGHSLLPQESLQELVAPFVGRTLTFFELQQAADAVASAYRQAGSLARVFLPEQEVQEGVVTLQIIESRFAGLRFEGEPPKLVQREAIAAYFTDAHRLGEPLKLQSLDQALLLVDDLPGVNVAGTLAQGQNEGDTELVLQTTDEARVYGDVGIDNAGAVSTGTLRMTANLNINSPGGRGELININLLRTDGSDYARFAFSVPDGTTGRRLGVSISEVNYQVISGPASIEPARVRGRSGSLGLDLTQPLVRERNGSLSLVAGVDNKSFFTRDIQVRSDYESNAGRLGLTGSWTDALGGGGANAASVQFVKGRLGAIQAHPNIDKLSLAWEKWLYSISRLQTLNAQHSLLFSVSGQHTSQTLDSSERFFIGGASSVRAYPSSELGGDRGYLASGEWRLRLTPAWLASAFVDTAQVTQLPAQLGDSPAVLNLRGYGMALGWRGETGLNARLTWARRIGQNPKPTASGTDGDGTLVLDRLWLNLGWSF